MKNQDVLIIYPESKEQYKVVKAFLDALDIKFEQSESETYNPEFVAKILEGKKDIELGRGVALSLQELKDLCK